MARIDKSDPMVSTFRVDVASDFLDANIGKLFGWGLDSAGKAKLGVGPNGKIVGVWVINDKPGRVGPLREVPRIDLMRAGCVTDFGPTAGTPGVTFGVAGADYYSDSSGNIVGGLDEVQTITVTAGGTPVTLSWNGQGPQSVGGGANGSTLTPVQVQAALEALSNIDPGDVAVGGPTGGPFVVTFGGQYADKDQPAISGTNATVVTGTAGGAVTGLFYVGTCVEPDRLEVNVHPVALA